MNDRAKRRFAERFMLRMPDGMRKRLHAAAEANNRSLNAEIVARLEVSLEMHGGDTLADHEARIRRLEEILKGDVDDGPDGKGAG